MGYQNPFGNPTDNYNCWLFDWRQVNQTSTGFTAYEGFTLNHINGTIPPAQHFDYFWGHTDNPPLFDNVGNNYGTTLGWADNTTHQFTLIYTLTQLKIIIDGDTIFSETGCFEPGRFGFYNFSQENVLYSNFSYEMEIDYKVETPNICVNDTGHFQFLDSCVSNYNFSMVDNMIWDYGDGSIDTVFNPDANTINTMHVYNTPGNYNVVLVVEDPSGCKDTANHSISVSGAVININTTSEPLCYGDSTGTIDISASGGTTPYQFSWSNGETTEDLFNLPSGSYMVTLTDTNGCTDTASITLSYPAELMVSAVQNDISCNGAADGSIGLLAAGGTAPYLYAWSDGSVTSSNASLAAGIYFVTITDNNGCMDTLSATLTEPAELLLTAIADGNVSCNGQADGGATVIAFGGTPAYSYSWSNGETTSTIINMTGGTYSVTLTDANGCNDTSSVMIEEPTVLAAVATTTDALCWGSNDGTVSLNISGGIGPYDIEWSGADTNALSTGNYPFSVTDANGCNVAGSIDIFSPNQLQIDTLVTSVSCFGYADGAIDLTVTDGTPPYTFNWSDGSSTEDLTSVIAGPYTLTITDGNGCQGSISSNVVQPPFFEVDILGNTSLCIGDAIILTASNGVNFIWSTAETSSEITIQPGTSTNIWLTAFENSCLAYDTVAITVNPLPTVSAGNDTTITYGTVLTLNGNAAGSYYWSPEDGLSCIDCPNPSVMPEIDITYYLKSTDNNGCMAMDSIRIKVINPDVFVANIFSPNGDGKNDELLVMGATKDNFRFAVYDRWGNLIFETGNLLNGWDGTIKGKQVNPGVYVFTYGFTDKMGNPIIGHGDVTVLW